jgi:hypothetical protein
LSVSIRSHEPRVVADVFAEVAQSLVRWRHMLEFRRRSDSLTDGNVILSVEPRCFGA